MHNRIDEDTNMAMYPQSRLQIPGVMTDIHDGSEFHALASDFLSVPEHTGLYAIIPK